MHSYKSYCKNKRGTFYDYRIERNAYINHSKICELIYQQLHLVQKYRLHPSAQGFQANRKIRQVQLLLELQVALAGPQYQLHPAIRLIQAVPFVLGDRCPQRFQEDLNFLAFRWCQWVLLRQLDQRVLEHLADRRLQRFPVGQDRPGCLEDQNCPSDQQLPGVLYFHFDRVVQVLQSFPLFQARHQVQYPLDLLDYRHYQLVRSRP